jgi:hypothetical protein
MPCQLLQFGALVPDYDPLQLGRRHVRLGWWAVFGFGGLGLALETLHGFKIGAYLDVANETRRLMWTLAHAHGTLLGVLNIAFGLSVLALPSIGGSGQRLSSQALLGAIVLLPGGFFLGGVRFYAGDPGLGVALVPVGAALLLLAVWTIARSIPHQDKSSVKNKN